MLTDATSPAHMQTRTLLGWIAAEIWDHLWPWSRLGFERQWTLQAAGAGLAIAVTLVWILAALQRLDSAVIIGWWAGWSLFELLIRLHSKPYVKEGPWWGRRYRVASPMDMLSYVCFKNLLIGGALFIAIESFGYLLYF